MLIIFSYHRLSTNSNNDKKKTSEYTSPAMASSPFIRTCISIYIYTLHYHINFLHEIIEQRPIKEISNEFEIDFPKKCTDFVK